jgi:hypothetical protein
MALDIDGAMQQAPQPGRQFMRLLGRTVLGHGQPGEVIIGRRATVACRDAIAPRISGRAGVC